MRRLVTSIPLALLLAACSPSQPPPQQHPPTPQASHSAPANATLGSADWYAWVDHVLGIEDGAGHGPEHGSAEWNTVVQRKLGQEAPQSKPGSPQWQQAVDALLRTRVVPDQT
jgi:hypothetical protein